MTKTTKKTSLAAATTAAGMMVPGMNVALQAARPNIVFIMADDLGYSDLGCYGSEIETPVLDRLAENGLRFSTFYSYARCWPSRTALLTGFYPQQTNSDPLRQGAVLPSFVRPLPRHLKAQGYGCYHVGKWHVRPGSENPLEPGGAMDFGFDHSYNAFTWNNFFANFADRLDGERVPPAGPEYYSTTETVTRALDFLQDHQTKDPGRPFFLYLAFLAPHFPLHAPEEDIERYHGRYDAGWDQVRQERYDQLVSMGLVNTPLSERMTDFTDGPMTQNELKERIGPGETATNVHWVDLSDEEKEFQAKKMEIHAAMVDRMDREIGRLVSWLEQTGQLNNTLIMFASDNGASSEILIRGDGHDPEAPAGSAKSYLCLGPGWAATANTPFRYSKKFVYGGGIASPLIVHWPAGIKDRGAIRHTEAHIIDILPTLTAAAGGTASDLFPEDAPPLPGKNLLPAFSGENILREEGLFFAHLGTRAIRKEGWKTVRYGNNPWELYCMEEDRAETRDVAQQYPERLNSLINRWETLNTEFAAQAGEKIK